MATRIGLQPVLSHSASSDTDSDIMEASAFGRHIGRAQVEALINRTSAGNNKTEDFEIFKKIFKDRSTTKILLQQFEPSRSQQQEEQSNPMPSSIENLKSALTEVNISAEDRQRLINLLETHEFRSFLDAMSPKCMEDLIRYNSLSNEDKNFVHTNIADYWNPESPITPLPRSKEKSVTFSTHHKAAHEVYHQRNPSFLSHLIIRIAAELASIGLEAAALVLVEPILLKSSVAEIHISGHKLEGAEYLAGHVTDLKLDTKSKAIATTVAAMLAYSPHIFTYTLMPLTRWVIKGANFLVKTGRSTWYQRKLPAIEEKLASKFEQLNQEQKQKLIALFCSYRSMTHDQKKIADEIHDLLTETIHQRSTVEFLQALKEIEGQPGSFIYSLVKTNIINTSLKKQHTETEHLPLVAGWFSFVGNLAKKRHISYSISGLASIASIVTLNIGLIVATLYYAFEKNALDGLGVIEAPHNFSEHGNETYAQGSLEMIELTSRGLVINSALTILYALLIPRMHKPVQALFIKGSEVAKKACLSLYTRCCRPAFSRLCYMVGRDHQRLREEYVSLT